MIVFDFDGTLIDLWPRYHAVFCEAANLHNVELADYKNVKQRVLKDSLVAQFFGGELPENYFERKKVLLEDDAFLKLDKLFFRIDELQEVLNDEVLILSKRRNPSTFYREIERLGIRCKSYTLEKGEKKDWIKAHPMIGDSLIIGDALSDLQVGELSSITAWMVGFGLNTYEQFSSTGIPFRYIHSPSDLLRALRERRGKNAV